MTRRHTLGNLVAPVGKAVPRPTVDIAGVPIAATAGELAELVRASRERALLTQDELAERSGLSVGTVRGLESGRIRRPRASTLRLIADALALSATDRAALVGSVAGVNDDTAASSPSGPWMVPAQLPVAVRGFVGRDEELTLLDRTANAVEPASPRPVAVIAGMAGVGKTTLALHWAHRARHHFPDGQLYVDLRGFHPAGTPVTPAEALLRILDALQVPAQRIPASVEARAGLYRSLLADRRMLIVLDNARDAEQVRALLPGSRTCFTVVTSRYRLSGLVAAEGARLLALDLLSEPEARVLLTERLGGERVRAEPDAADAVVAGCARLPLALVIAAARAVTEPALSLAVMADQLRQVRERLDALDRDDPATDLRAVFSWSYRVLSPAAARLLRLLSLPPGPDIGISAAASLAAAAQPQVALLLAELADAHLLDSSAPGRYSLHDLLRGYAGELSDRLDPESERQVWRRRLLDHYLHTAHAAAMRLEPHRSPLALPSPDPDTVPEAMADHVRATSWFAAERSVLVAVQRDARDTGFDGHAWRLAWAMRDLLDRAGLWEDNLSVQRIGQDAASHLGDPAARAQADKGAGLACVRLERLDEARRNLTDALTWFRQSGDLAAQADVTCTLAQVLWSQNERQGSIDYAIDSLSLYVVTGNLAGQARVHNNLGWLMAQLGDHLSAVNHCFSALALQQRLGDRRGAAATWHSLGHAHHELGDFRAAVNCYRRAVDLLRAFDQRYEEAEALARLGEAYVSAGDPGSARTAWESSLRLLTALEHPEADHVRSLLTSVGSPATSA